MGSRTWIKIYTDKWLDDSISQETVELRGVWIGLLVLAGAGRYGDTGEIKLGARIGLSDEQLAETLNIPLRIWLKQKARLIETKRIQIQGKNIIFVKKWQKYQSEYQRQKPFRIVKLLSGVTSKSNKEKEKEKEKEGRGEYPSSPPIPLVPSNNNKLAHRPMLLNELLKLDSWGNSQLDKDAEWLTEFLAEFPQLTVSEVRGCRDYHSSKQKHSKGMWKTRIRNWMNHKRGGDGKHKHNSRDLPKVYTPEPTYED